MKELVEMSLDEYVAKYYEEVKEDIPQLITYVDLITNEIFYYSQVYSIHSDKFKQFRYNNKMDKLEVFEVCSEILDSLNPEYNELFKQLLREKQIIFSKKEESNMDTSTKIRVHQTRTIEDIFGMIHELFHKIHISKYDNKFDDPNWYFPSEMIAMMFEMYAVFYLYKQDRYRDDIKTYFNKLFDRVYGIACLAAHEALILDVYDHYHSIEDDKIEEFRQKKQMSKEMISILDIFLSDDGDFSYHENGTYLFGYPISLSAGLSMAYDSNYLQKVLSSFERINTMSLEEFLKAIDLSEILNKDNPDYLYDVFENMNQFIDYVNKGEVKGKELVLGG